MTKNYWFKAKRYGWGWYPSSWQGWLILAVYLILLLKNFYRIDSVSHSASDTLRPFFFQTILLTLLLIGICYVTGEPPRWRWGDEKKTSKKK